MFGQSTSTNTFGQPSAFNTSATPFSIGNTQSQPLFGQTSQTSLFGGIQPGTNSLFGSPQTQQTNTFGTQPAFGSSSLFGNTGQTSQTQQNSIFSNRFGNTFGSTTGLGTTLNVPTGTTIKYAPQSTTDTIIKNGHSQGTNINVRLQCITCMREYESKSLEELRLEDYIANRKGPMQTNLFGSSTMNSGTFSTGITNNAFGQSSGTNSLFSNSKPFGSITATTTSTTSLFNTGLSTSSSGIFGQNTSNSTFGQQTDNKSFFNQSSAAPSMNSFSFGQQNSLTGSNPSNLFNTNTSGSSMFGQNSLTGNKSMFGSNLTTPFVQAQQQPSTNNIFGVNTTGQNTGIFGTTSQPSIQFNASNTAMSKPNSNFAFSQPSLTQNSGFNPSTSSSNIFGSGSTNTGFGTNTASLFGTSTLGSNSFGSFGTSTGTQPFHNTNSSFNFNLGSSNAFGSTGMNTFNTSGLSTNMFNTNQQQSLATTAVPLINSDQIITRLQTLPYGTPPPLSLDSSLQNNNKTKFTTDPKTLNQYKLNAKSQNEIKIQRTPVNEKPTTLLFDGLDDESPENLKTAADIFQPRQNIKKLILNKNTSENLSTSMLKTTIIKSSSPINDNNQDSFNKENESPSNTTSISFSKELCNNTMNFINKASNKNDGINKDQGKEKINNLSPTISPEKSFTVYGSLNFSSSDHEISTSINYVPPKCGVILTRTDYYTIPSLEECDQFYNPDDDSCLVENFTVARIDYGSIYWRGPLNIQGINLDEIVHIRRKEVIVYPDDDLKPPIGEGLNRSAQITLDQVWPIDKTTREFIKDSERLRIMKYAEKLEKATIKLDATFKEYRPDTGSWVFVVKHFSKYGLNAEDEDVEIEPIKGDQEKLDKTKQIPAQQQTFIKQPFEMKSTNPNEIIQQIDVHSSETFKKKLEPIDSSIISDESSEPKFLNRYLKYDSNTFNFNEDHSKIKDSFDDEYSVMRSALFVDDEVETMSKKCKNLSFTKSQVSSYQMVGTALFPAKFKAKLPKKRRLTFNPKPSIHKANVYSRFYTDFPKARFINGSNKFCLIIDDKVTIFDLNLFNLDQTQSIDKLEKHLESYSTIEQIENDALPPLITTNAYSLNPKFDDNINSLIEALYGELGETSDYARHQERVRRILNWLFNFNKSLPVPENSFNRIIHFLTTNELDFAIMECINSKLPRLSYLVSCGPYCKKQLIIAQLDLWKRSEADIFIEKDLLKIYVILSGASIWKISNGELIQPLDGLQWTQQMVLLLLYKNRTENDLIGTNLIKETIKELTYKPNIVEYHLLAQHQPWVAITASKNLLDSWLLQESLQSYLVINENMVTNKCDSINIFMASQTRDLRWAIFFALHIKDEFLRCFYVKELLARNAKQLDQELEKFLTEKYKIDLQLLAEAKLYLAKTNRNHLEIALNLLIIKQFKEAHDLLVNKIFPELVINEDHKEIMELIDKLKPHKHLIPNWDLTGAGIYDIFIQLLQFGRSADLNHYRQLIENFNVHHLSCPTNRHVLCQSQMTRVANIIHAEMNDGMFAYHTAIPYDYSLLELRSNAYKLYESKIMCFS